MAVGYTPSYSISVGGTDVTNNVAGRLLSLTVVDAEGKDSDTCSIEIDDRDGVVAIPPKGSVVSVSMGYLETGLTFMGTYTVDEVKCEGFPMRMTISAKSVDMRQQFKQHRHKAYTKQTVEQIVSAIAQRQGLSPAVGGSVGSFLYDYIAQQGESDLHFVTRLAKRHDAIAKVANGNLIFVARGDATSASGIALPVITVTNPPDVISYNASFKDRPAHKNSTATWWDRKNVKVMTEQSSDQVDDESSGESQPSATFGVRPQHPNQQQAKASANSKQSENDKDTRSLSITVIGDTEIKAECLLIVSGIRTEVDDVWRIKSATHHLNNDGYTTTIQGEKPGSSSSGGSSGSIP